jgi:phosphoribosylglycinamide formyltransferase 2
MKPRHGRKKLQRHLVVLDFWSGIFLADDGVYFSELSLAHDTGMVTLAGTQNFNEFELHLRAILSLPILKLPWRSGASAVILASENIKPTYGLEQIAALPKTDFNLW